MVSTSGVGPKVFLSPSGGAGATRLSRRRIIVEDINGVTIVNFVDKKILDEANMQRLGEELSSLVDGSRKVVLNFSNVEYMSANFFGRLITFKNSLLAAGGKPRFCCLCHSISEVFRITHLNEIFDIKKDEQAALDGF